MLDLGSMYTGEVTITDGTGTLVNPTTVACSITLPDQSTVVATPSNVSTGIYQVNYITTQVGLHFVNWSAASTGTSWAYADSFDVRNLQYAPLVSLSDLKDHLNMPATDTTHDLELFGFLDAATDFVTFNSGPIIPRTYTNEIHDGGWSMVVLNNPPIISVTSVIEYVALTAYTLTNQPPGSTVDNFGYSLDDPRSGILYRRGSAGQITPFWGGPGGVVVTYVAGRTTLPASIRMAALLDIADLYQTSQQGGRPNFAGSSGVEDEWNVGPAPMFPRLAAQLQGPSRTPSIA